VGHDPVVHALEDHIGGTGGDQRERDHGEDCDQRRPEHPGRDHALADLRAVPAQLRGDRVVVVLLLDAHPPRQVDRFREVVGGVGGQGSRDAVAAPRLCSVGAVGAVRLRAARHRLRPLTRRARPVGTHMSSIMSTQIDRYQTGGRSAERQPQAHSRRVEKGPRQHVSVYSSRHEQPKTDVQDRSWPVGDPRWAVRSRNVSPDESTALLTEQREARQEAGEASAAAASAAEESRQAAEEESARAAEESASAEAAEQASTAAAAREEAAQEDAERQWRNDVVGDIEAAVQTMAEEDLEDGLIEGDEVSEVSCSPVAGGSVGDLDQETTALQCFASTEENDDGTWSGYYYDSTVN